ncbi:hypothetical protein Y1Q_0016083 [Alligator mississippiensis]|uniref:Uncharacterized protein n=1 Tax=Alligator mississippiensis TaxID=8496 RepID=A0A151P179_ALLMI|nr:hypothetical protein Y1Q_0016083 [Alligator mississippiensis]
MASHHPSRETQELQHVLLVNLCDSHWKLQDITCAHLDMTQQLVAMACSFVLQSQQLDNTCRATHHTVHPPSILDRATDFHVVNKDCATQDTIDARVLWHHLQGGSELTTLALTGGSKSSQTLGTTNNGSRSSTFAGPPSWTLAQLAPHITCQDISIWPCLTLEQGVAIASMKLATPSSYHYVTNQFSMGKTTAGKVIQEVYLVIQGILVIHRINPQEKVPGF